MLKVLCSELIANAWKHAFKGRKEGCIDITLQRQQGEYCLVVEDNGVGVQDLDRLSSPDSFGYTIIHGLGKQLRAKLHFSLPAGSGKKVEVRICE